MRGMVGRAGDVRTILRGDVAAVDVRPMNCAYQPYFCTLVPLIVPPANTSFFVFTRIFTPEPRSMRGPREAAVQLAEATDLLSDSGSPSGNVTAAGGGLRSLFTDWQSAFTVWTGTSRHATTSGDREGHVLGPNGSSSSPGVNGRSGAGQADPSGRDGLLGLTRVRAFGSIAFPAR